MPMQVRNSIFNLILINLNSNNHLWPVASVLDSTMNLASYIIRAHVSMNLFLPSKLNSLKKKEEVMNKQKLIAQQDAPLD